MMAPNGNGRRRKKQGDVEDVIDESKATEARKNSELTEDERHALHLRHCREYEIDLEAKKKADAKLKNCGKRIKAEGDSVVKVKKTIQARSPEGEAELRAEIEETAEVLRWAGTRVGESKELFPDGALDLTEAAFAKGKRDGLDGQPCKPPDEYGQPQREAYMNGWRVGQDALMSAFAKKPEPQETTEVVDPPPPAADAAATQQPGA